MTDTTLPPLDIGIISDTHGLLRPAALEALAGVSHILHAGDVGRGMILEKLREIAPVTAVRGNVDYDPPLDGLPLTEWIELGGLAIYMIHIREDLDLDPRSAGLGMVIYGHSHKPEIVEKNGVLYVNPGSAGPRRFSLPVTLARMRISAGVPEVWLVELD